MESLLANWPLFVMLLGAGLAAGFTAGLFGVGGGFVIVPAMVAVLTLFGGAQETMFHMAIGTSLGAMIFTSLRSANAHSKRGAVDFDTIKAWAPWVIVGVALGTLLESAVDGQALILVFAIGVLVFSIPMLFGRPDFRLSDTMPRGPWLVSAASFLGFHSSLLGIGGATYSVMIMTMCGKVIHQAVGTAAAFGVFIAIPGAIGNVIIGLGVDGRPPGSLGYVSVPGVIAIAAMTLITAPMGAKLAHKLDPGRLRKVFGVYLIFTSMLLMRKGLGI